MVSPIILPLVLTPIRYAFSSAYSAWRKTHYYQGMPHFPVIRFTNLCSEFFFDDYTYSCNGGSTGLMGSYLRSPIGKYYRTIPTSSPAVAGWLTADSPSTCDPKKFGTRYYTSASTYWGRELYASYGEDGIVSAVQVFTQFAVNTTAGVWTYHAAGTINNYVTAGYSMTVILRSPTLNCPCSTPLHL